MRVDFTNPLAFLLLSLIPLALFLARNSLANLSRGRAVISAAVRVLLLLLVVLALAGLRIRTTSRDLALIFLVDVSASVAQDNRTEVFDFINREITNAATRDYVGVVAFAREPSVELAPTRKEALGDWRISEISSNPPRDYTNIAAALRLATALVPEDASAKFVVISDGNENLDSSSKEAEILRASGIEVYSRAIGTTTERGQSRNEVAIRDLEVPEHLAEGEGFDLRVTIDTTRDTDVTLRVYRNDSVVTERTVHVAASGENVFVLPQRVEQKGFYSYRAEVEAIGSDAFVQNNSREAFAIVEGQPKTLYLYGDARPSPGIVRVLSEGNFAVDTRAAAAAPATLAGFQNYDLVIFDKDDPVYAVWQYGLGRSAAFTSDAKPKWAAGWMNWPGFGQFWTQAFRDALRRESASGLTPRIEINAGRGHVSVEATTPEGESRNNLRLRTHVIAPDLSTSDITLDQTAAGQYEGDFAAVARGAYLVSVSEDDGQQGTTAGAVNSYSPEFNIASQDVDLLARVSEMTGGELIPNGDAASPDLFARRSTKTIPHEIWETLMRESGLSQDCGELPLRVLIRQHQSRWRS